MDSLILDTVVGVLFIFATYSLLTSLLTEAISNFVGLRGEYLLRGIRSLVDEEHEFGLGWKDLLRRTPGQPEAKKSGAPAITPLIVNKSYIGINGENAQMPKNAGDAALTNKARRQVPSYLSARSFSRAILDVIVTDEDGYSVSSSVRASAVKLPDGALRDFLLTTIDQSASSVEDLRHSIENWYDDHMSRVSGWYKRRVRWISVVVGALLVLLFNVNAVEITRSFYTDEALRASVVSQAITTANCDGRGAAECLDAVRDSIRSARDAGLPIGWGVVERCENQDCSWTDSVGLSDPDGTGWADVRAFAVILVGWLLMILSLLPGSRFWFDLLGRVGSMRSTGPKPTSS